MKQFILALDQGTTSSRALLFDKSGDILAIAQKELHQHFPKSGWVEHNPNEIWSSQVSVAAEAMSKFNISGDQLAGIGITNQRETTVVWDRKTGEPVYNAIVWQDRRTAGYCDELKKNGLETTIRNKTGLVIDAYFSGTKLKWILDNVSGVRAKAEKGLLAFGTIDSWLVWKLTDGQKHITDASNASRTMLFNIHTLTWDEELLKLMNIPDSMMPEVVSSSDVYGHTKSGFLGSEVPIGGIAGDQQAALFGQMCWEVGMVKNTYGTGCFMLMNTGNEARVSENKLLTTIAWQIGGKTTYALEGSIFMAGAVIQWLRDGLGIIKNAADIENLAKSVTDNGGLYFVPTFTGMGAPYWDQYARGLMIGLSRGSTSAHIARAALEGIAFQNMDILKLMEKDAQINIRELRVDGGASASDVLMQFQADLLGLPVIRPLITESTAMGAAYLAGLSTGFWENVEEIKAQWKPEKEFTPNIDPEKAIQMKSRWAEAIKRARNWEAE